MNKPKKNKVNKDTHEKNLENKLVNIWHVIKIINKMRKAINELINGKNRKGSLTVITELLNKVLKTLKTIENCTSCKDSINEIENCIAKLEKEKEKQRYDNYNTFFHLNNCLF